MGNTNVANAQNQKSSSKQSFSNTSQNCDTGLSILCTRMNNDGTMNQLDSNEIILSKSSYYPKGTFSPESMRFFTEEEIDMFNISKGDNIPGLRYLTLKGVHINILDQDRTSPLHIACHTGSLQMVEEIINQGAMINIPDISGWTSLHIAAFFKRADIILLLLKKGAGLNTKNREGLRPIDLIDKNKQCEEVFVKFSQIAKQTAQMEIYETTENDYVNQLAVSSRDKETKMIKEFKSKKTNTKKNPMRANNSFNNIEELNGYNDEEENFENLVKETKKEICNKYKFIPKKHKFYLNYRTTNDRYEEFGPENAHIRVRSVQIGSNQLYNSVNLNSANTTKEKSIIKPPRAFPLTTSIQELNDYFTLETNDLRLSYASNPNSQANHFSKKKDEDLMPNYQYFTEEKQIVIPQSEREKFQVYLSSDEEYNDESIDLDNSMMNDLQNSKAIDGRMFPKKFSSRNRTGRTDEKILNSTGNCLQQFKLEEESQPDPTTRCIKEDSFFLSEEYANCDEDNIKSDLNSLLNSKVFSESETDYFITKINFAQIFFNTFQCTEKQVETILIYLFNTDCNFALLMAMNILGVSNTYTSLLSMVKETITSPLLRALILTKEYSKADIHQNLNKVYFVSFEGRNSIVTSIENCFNNISCCSNLVQLWTMCQQFSRAYYPLLRRNIEGVDVKSKNALAYLTFGLLLSDYLIWKEKNFTDKIKKVKYRKLFFDLTILLKNLNEGDNFDTNFLKNCFKRSNSVGHLQRFLPEIFKGKNKKSITLAIGSQMKQFSFVFYSKLIFLFDNLKTDTIRKMFYIDPNLHKILPDSDNFKLTIEMDKKNIVAFKNKLNSIKYKKHSKVSFLFPDKESFSSSCASII